MLKGIAGVVLVASLVFSQGCNESEEGREHRGRRRGGWGGPQMEERLKNLPPECREKVKALWAEAKEKEAQLSKESLSDEDRRARRRAIRQEMRGRREAILKDCKGAGAFSSPSVQPSAESAVEE